MFYQVKLHPSQARANKKDFFLVGKLSFLVGKITFPGWRITFPGW